MRAASLRVEANAKKKKVIRRTRSVENTHVFDGEYAGLCLEHARDREQVCVCYLLQYPNGYIKKLWSI